jgi:ADP-dependent NAD(P)H-hydrate dehydratase / NAD(P)H-hydrate epimerase
LIDGDGLTALVDNLELLAKRNAPTVLTPHMGEMARLTGKSVGEISQDRIGVLREACAAWQSIVVLKGAHSLIGLPDGRVFINLSGNSGMGSAGTGDVLTGTIAAMVGLGLDVEDATRMGVFIHGVAGDLAAQTKGEDGMTAQDLLDHLPHAMRAARTESLTSRYAIPVVS